MGMAPYSLDSPIASVDFQKANTDWEGQENFADDIF